MICFFRFFLCFAVFCSFSVPSLAQEALQEVAVPELNAEICDFMVAHHPDANVAYRPGVDIHGKPVVEADIGGSSLYVQPDEITFPVSVDLAKYAGIALPEGVETKGDVGSITVDLNGVVTFNGKPLEGEAEAALRRLCVAAPENSGEADKE